MKQWLRTQAWMLVILVGLVAAAFFLVRGRGIDARGEPSWVETQAALFVRSWMTPPDYKRRLNPVTVSPGILISGREHFADHCASCHGNDGSGNSGMGRKLYPSAPDMRLARTQQLTDGELFYFIEHGIRFTGMPGWSNGTPEGETASWHLVHFIRHLPKLTPEELQEMEAFNPVSKHDLEEEQQAEDFLNGGEPAPPTGHEGHAGHQPPPPPKP
ncbi:MAG: cytochrome c [Vicinamibacterales bacterium]